MLLELRSIFPIVTYLFYILYLLVYRFLPHSVRHKRRRLGDGVSPFARDAGQREVPATGGRGANQVQSPAVSWRREDHPSCAALASD